MMGLLKIDIAHVAGQPEPAAHVVVMDVGLEHVGDADTQSFRRGYVTLLLALGVDDDSDLTVMDEVAPVAEPGRLEADHLDLGPGVHGNGAAAGRSAPPAARRRPPTRSWKVVSSISIACMVIVYYGHVVAKADRYRYRYRYRPGPTAQAVRWPGTRLAPRAKSTAGGTEQ